MGAAEKLSFNESPGQNTQEERETFDGITLQDPYRNLEEILGKIEEGATFSHNEVIAHITSGVTTNNLLQELAGTEAANDEYITYDAHTAEGTKITHMSEDVSLNFLEETVIKLQRGALEGWAVDVANGDLEKALLEIISGNAFMHREKASRKKGSYSHLIDDADKNRVHYLNPETSHPAVNYHSLVDNVQSYLLKNIEMEKGTKTFVLKENDMKNMLEECGISSPACMTIIGGILSDILTVIELANDSIALRKHDNISAVQEQGVVHVQEPGEAANMNTFNDSSRVSRLTKK